MRLIHSFEAVGGGGTRTVTATVQTPSDFSLSLPLLLSAPLWNIDCFLPLRDYLTLSLIAVFLSLFSFTSPTQSVAPICPPWVSLDIPPAIVNRSHLVSQAAAAAAAASAVVFVSIRVQHVVRQRLSCKRRAQGSIGTTRRRVTRESESEAENE